MAHYRKQLEFSLKGLEVAQNTHNKLKNIAEELKDVHGIIVPGAFGSRGAEGQN